MITVCDEAVLDSKLFERNDRVFWHLFLSCKVYEADVAKSDLVLYRMIFQGFNTVTFFVRYQQYVLAFKSLVLLKRHVFSSLPYGSGERQPSGKRFP